MGTSGPGRILAMLFTDIEGSTALLERVGDRYDSMLIEHRARIRDAIMRSGGTEVRTEGDSFFALFDDAPGAVSAAVAAQRALVATEAPDHERIRVRMGVHVGDVRFIGDDPVGIAVHQASRVMSAAHGEQIVVSGAVRDLCTGLDELSFVDLGEHRLKDLLAPQHLHQVTHPDLPAEFPPLRTLEVRRNNLPIELTSFVGREAVLAEVQGLLLRARLVTLTGAGGVGKTRLALQVAAEVLHDYPGGAWLIDLAPLTDPSRIPATIASVLGLRSGRGVPAEDGLVEHLRSRTALLVFDNCEHLIDACASTADLILRGCPDVRILATSREPLRLDGEVAVRIPSLDVEGGQQGDAIKLFAERAIAADPSFVLTDDVIDDVGRICRRLDGIALAIELAASRVRAMSPRQIAERVEDRFRLLTGGSRTAMARQRTLRATVDWSYDLLDEDERVLLRRLSVFSGGFTLEDAEYVCGGDMDVLDPLLRLVDRSLVLGEPRRDEVRYRMLETIRQYAGEKLADSGGSALMRDRHADWVVSMAVEAESLLEGRDQRRWLDSIEEQLDNIRAGMQWRLDAPDGAVDAAEIAASLWRLWWVRGLWVEGVRWLEAAYPRVPERTRLRGRVAWALGFLNDFIGAWGVAAGFADEALSIALDVGDRRLECYARFLRAFVGERDAKPERADEMRGTLTFARELGDAQVTAWCLLILGAMPDQDAAVSVSLNEEARAVAIEACDDWSHGMALNNLSAVAAGSGDLARAREIAEEAIALRGELRDPFGIAQSTYNLGVLAHALGDVAHARASLEESERLYDALGDRRGAAMSGVVLAMLAVWDGDVDRAEARVEAAIAAIEREEPGRALVTALLTRGMIDHARGRFHDARVTLVRVQDLSRQIGSEVGRTNAEQLLAVIDVDVGDPVLARGRMRSIVEDPAAIEAIDAGDAGLSLAETLAYVLAASSDRAAAALVLGAAHEERVRRSVVGVNYPDVTDLARAIEAEQPDEWARGRTISLWDAVRDAVPGPGPIRR